MLVAINLFTIFILMNIHLQMKPRYQKTFYTSLHQINNLILMRQIHFSNNRWTFLIVSDALLSFIEEKTNKFLALEHLAPATRKFLIIKKISMKILWIADQVKLISSHKEKRKSLTYSSNRKIAEYFKKLEQYFKHTLNIQYNNVISTKSWYYRKENCSLSSLWIFEGYICNLRPFSIAAEVYDKLNIHITNDGKRGTMKLNREITSSFQHIQYHQKRKKTPWYLSQLLPEKHCWLWQF